MTSEIIQTASGLDDALGRAQGGDTLLVQGQFGRIRLEDIRIDGGVTIAAAAPGAAHFERIEIKRCANMTLAGLSCWPLGPVERRKQRIHLIQSDKQSPNIEVTGSVFRGRADSDNHARWSKADWVAAEVSAVLLGGPRSVIRDNIAIGVNFGFVVVGHSSELYRNTVFGFSGDGLRVTEDNCVVIGNRVTDAVKIDENHPDGFQCFKLGRLLNGLVVKDNTILEWTVRPDNPLRQKLMGISLHDGPYANVVIRGNTIAGSSHNGIRVHDVRNIEITGNRIRHADGKRGDLPALRVLNCSGTIVVEDNQAEKFVIPRGAGRRNREPDYSVPY